MFELDRPKIGAETGADIADKFCNTDAGGFNAALACAIPEAVKGVAVLISDTMEFIDGDIDSQTIDTSFECLGQINTSVGDSNAALDSIETKAQTQTASRAVWASASVSYADGAAGEGLGCGRHGPDEYEAAG